MNVINKVSDNSSRKKVLTECLKSNSRVGKKAEKDKYRLCYVGFMMYDRKIRRYSQFRASNIGRTREMKFKRTSTQKEIIEFAKSKFLLMAEIKNMAEYHRSAVSNSVTRQRNPFLRK